MVVQTQPEETDDAPVVMVSSDASDNISAIHEIDQWARDHGFVRSSEYHLGRRQTAEGKMLFASPCYRLDESFKRAADTDLARIRERRERMPMTASSADLLRDEA